MPSRKTPAGKSRATQLRAKKTSAKKAAAKQKSGTARDTPLAGGRRPTRDGRRYWLVKSEPSTFSFEDLLGAPGRTTGWDGVRNYAARNFMRDEMRVGDGVLFYHSNAEPPGVVGIAEVASAAYPDPTQFDPTSDYYDPKASREAPIWMQVDIRAVEALPRALSLDELRGVEALAGMELLRKGSRLSVQPVAEEEWEAISALL